MERSLCMPAAAAGFVGLLLAGCDSASKNPVIFGQTTTVGISIGQSQTTQAPEFVLGYKDANVAILPTVAEDGAGNVATLGGTVTNPQNGVSFEETYSVLGQFEVNTPTSIAAEEAGLGKFFATGLAAQKLSAGFACALSDGRDATHCHSPAGAASASGPSG